MRIITVLHGQCPVNEYEVDITQRMRDMALAFAAKIKLDDNQFSRLLPAQLNNRTPENILKSLKLEIQRTYVGKLGELAFWKLLYEKGIKCDTTGMFQIYEGQRNTDSYDFKTAGGGTVDIKTGFRSNHTRLLVNMDQFNRIPKDYYVAVKLSAKDVPQNDKLILWDSVDKAIIKGYADHTYLSRIPEGNFGEAFAKSLNYSQLTGIDSLLSLF